MFYTKIINVVLRFSTMVAKFCLIFLLAKYLEPVDVGLYGLLTATIAYSLFALGFDFYTFSTREIVCAKRSEWCGLLRDQFAFFGIVYSFVIPLLLLLFIVEFLPWEKAPWFFCLVILEHISQELSRLLIAISRQIIASIILFFRFGLWAIVISIWMYFYPDVRNLDYVLGGWVVGALMACILGFCVLYKLDRSSLSRSINWEWLVKGVKTAFPFLAATLAIRALFTIDRYWIEMNSGLEVLAPYVLFIGITNSLMNFLDSGVFVFFYPKLIETVHRNDEKLFLHKLKQMTMQTIFLIVAFSGVAIVAIKPLLIWLNRDLYQSHINLFPPLLLSIGIYAISMIPHYAIYALNQDKYIIKSHLVSLIVFIMSSATLQSSLQEYTIPVSLIVSFVYILLSKSIAFYKIKNSGLWNSGVIHAQ